jgi:hypothetical protein
MTFKVDSRIFEKFPDVRIGYIFVTGIDNSQPENNNLIKRITEESQKIRKELSIDTVSALPYVSRWRAIYKEFGYDLPRTSSEQANICEMVSMDDLKPGDLIFYSNSQDEKVNHVGIYIGDDKVIHAKNAKVGVTIQDINYRTPLSAGRIISD